MSHTPSETPHDNPRETSPVTTSATGETPRTPARRGEMASTPALPGPIESAVQPPDIDPPRDLGWGLVMAGSIGVMIASWTLFGQEADGMWAGYWATLLGVAAVLGALWLRSTLPKAPGLGLAGLSGAGMILVGIVQNYPAIITIPLIGCGAAVILGVGLAASSSRT